MRRTLTLGAFAAAGYSLNEALAFHVPLGARTGSASSRLPPPPVSTGTSVTSSSQQGRRPRVGAVQMTATGPPNTTVDSSSAGTSVGGDGTHNAGDGSSEPEDAFAAAEKEFEEAKAKSLLEEGAEGSPEAGAETEVAAEAAEASALDGAAKPVASPASESAPVAEDAVEKPDVGAAEVMASSEVKPAEAEAPEAEAEGGLGGMFNFGASSLEEFFGLSSKPRLVPAKKPLPEDVEASGMPELDPAVVDSMIKESGLNEVTLKEDFKAMEAEAKATQEAIAIEAAEAPAIEAEKAPSTSTVSEDKDVYIQNPFASALSMFSPKPRDAPAEVVSPEPEAAVSIEPEVEKPEPVPETAKAEATSGFASLFGGILSSPTAADAKDTEEPERPSAKAPAKIPPAAKVEAPAPPEVTPTPKESEEPANPFAALASMFSLDAGAPSSAPAAKDAAEPAPPAQAAKVVPAKSSPRPSTSAKQAEPVVAAKEEAPEKGIEKAEAAAGLGALFGSMFAPPVYDDEVDTLPTKAGSPRALPVFAPPPAPAKPAPAKPAPKAAPAKPAPKKASPAAEKAAAPAPSFLDDLFGGGRSGKETPEPPVSTEGRPSSPAAKKPMVAATTAPPAKVEKPKSSSSGPSSIFGDLFGGAKAEKKVEVPAPAPVAPPAPAKKEAPAPKASFDFFGMLGSGGDSDKASTPPKVSAGPPSTPARKAPAASRKSVAAVAKPAPPTPKPSPAPAPGLFDFFGSSKPAKSAPVESAPKPEAEKKPSSPFDLFGGGGSFGSAGAKTKPAVKPKPKRPPAPTPVSPPPAPAVSRVKTMDDAFLRKVSVMLKRNQTKIKKFQQLTDRFRGGLIKAPTYYEGVEELFGEDNVEEIIGPLLAALPENDKRKTLQSVYTKAQKARDGGSSGDGGQEGGGGFNFFGFGAKPSIKPKTTPAATPVSGRSKGGGAASGPATGDPYAFAAAKLSAADYQLFKKRTELFARGGINARNYYDTLVKVFGKDGVSSQFQAVVKTLPESKRKLLQDVYKGLNQ